MNLDNQTTIGSIKVVMLKGSSGAKGDPGEVTTAQMNAAISAAVSAGAKYATGDTFAIDDLSTAGSATAATLVSFDVYTPKSMEDITTVTVTTCTGTVKSVGLGTDGGTPVIVVQYLDGHFASTDWTQESGVTVSATKVSDHYIRVQMRRTTDFTNLVSSSPVTVHMNVGVSFS